MARDPFETISEVSHSSLGPSAGSAGSSSSPSPRTVLVAAMLRGQPRHSLQERHDCLTTTTDDDVVTTLMNYYTARAPHRQTEASWEPTYRPTKILSHL